MTHPGLPSCGLQFVPAYDPVSECLLQGIIKSCLSPNLGRQFTSGRTGYYEIHIQLNIIIYNSLSTVIAQGLLTAKQTIQSMHDLISKATQLSYTIYVQTMDRCSIPQRGAVMKSNALGTSHTIYVCSTLPGMVYRPLSSLTVSSCVGRNHHPIGPCLTR